jgi:hypothetical protein
MKGPSLCSTLVEENEPPEPVGQSAALEGNPMEETLSFSEKRTPDAAYPLVDSKKYGSMLLYSPLRPAVEERGCLNSSIRQRYRP